MHQGALLIVGVGGLGSLWAERAHSRCSRFSDLLLIDADEKTFNGSAEAHCLHLDASGEAKGSAALPMLAKHRLNEGFKEIQPLIDKAELVIILTCLGGGVGSGAASEFARLARESDSMVVSIVGFPFAEQPIRYQMAEESFPELYNFSNVCIRVSLERLSWQSKERKLDWKKGAGWIEELVEGLLSTLAKVGKINLDLMDFRTIVEHPGEATILVGSGPTNSLSEVVKTAFQSPLSNLDIDGAKGCWIQVEGGPDMTIYQLNRVTEEFVSRLDSNCQVLLGARSTDEMIGRVRVVAVVSGL
jgi:cell division protein FtsZ